eukprot:8216702-Pyramimonas_sp.AAC.1
MAKVSASLGEATATARARAMARTVATTRTTHGSTKITMEKAVGSLTVWLAHMMETRQLQGQNSSP